MGFAKLVDGIIHSSIWNEPLATRVLWITLLAMKDENGLVAASRSGLIRAANITEEEFNLGIFSLESPDQDSRTPNNEGRRIEKISGGWLILNHEIYKLDESKKREQTRERVRKYREKHNPVTQCNVTPALPSVSVSVSTSLSSEEGGCKGGDHFDAFWSAYPRKVGKGAARRAWAKIRQPAHIIQEIQKALEWQVKSDQWAKDSGQFIPHPGTYLNECRWEDEPPKVKVWLSTEELCRQALELEAKNGRATAQGH